MADTLPAIFFGHGHPMNAVLNNHYTNAWRLIGEHTVKPRAILLLSAHWFVPGSGVTSRCAPDRAARRSPSACCSRIAPRPHDRPTRAASPP